MLIVQNFKLAEFHHPDTFKFPAQHVKQSRPKEKKTFLSCQKRLRKVLQKAQERVTQHKKTFYATTLCEFHFPTTQSIHLGSSRMWNTCKIKLFLSVPAIHSARNVMLCQVQGLLYIDMQYILLTLIGMSYENKKNAHLQHHLGASFMRLNELGRVSNYLNFHLQKCLEIFDKNSADKIQSKNYKGGKSALPHANQD